MDACSERKNSHARRAARTDAMIAKVPSTKAYAENTSTSDNMVTPGWKIAIRPKIMPSTPRIAKAHLSQQLCDVLFRGIFVRACRNRSLECGHSVLSGW